MVLPGHISGGYLATRLILDYIHPALSSTLSSHEYIALTAIGTLAGELPDVDLFRFYFEHKRQNPRVQDHREYITHAPLFWLVVSLVIAAIGHLFGSTFVTLLGAVILGGTWSHLLFDSIEYGVPWLWPFSKKHFALTQKVPTNTITATPGTLASHWQFIWGMYLKTWTFWAELVVTLAAIIAFVKTMLVP